MTKLLRRAAQATYSDTLLGKRRPNTALKNAPNKGNTIKQKRIAFNV
jgi:hypothetical protein